MTDTFHLNEFSSILSEQSIRNTHPVPQFLAFSFSVGLYRRSALYQGNQNRVRSYGEQKEEERERERERKYNNSGGKTEK